MMYKTLADHYRSLTVDRSEFLERGHRSAILTIPSVQPLEGQRRHELPQNFQSVGSRGVNNLTSKLMLTLFPPTLPFMKLEVSPADMARLQAEDAALEEQGDEARIVSEVTAGLLAIEQQAVSEFNTEGWRPVVSEAMRLLVVTGNACLFIRPENKDAITPIVADLRQFVAERDAEGTLQAVILKQHISPQTAAEYLGRDLTQAELGFGASADSPNLKDTVELYTGARRIGADTFEYWQEIAGEVIEGTEEEFPEDQLPLMPLRFSPVYGASYGRGYVEDYDGDLLVLEQISRSLAEAAMIMSKVIFLVRPGSSAKPQHLSKAFNGDFKIGEDGDVSAVQANKAGDLGIAYQQRNDITLALSKAFLLNSSVQRAGERVTSEEIRFVAQELEDALGGVYASLADTVQKPVVYFLFNRMKRRGAIRDVPDYVKPVIATGLEAISRNHRALRISQFLGTLNQLVAPDQVANIIRTDAVAADLATSLNLDKDQYILSKEEIEELRRLQQQQFAIEQLGSETIRQVGRQASQDNG